MGRSRSPLARPAAPAPNATLVRRHDLTPTIAHLWIAPDEGMPAFVPGQYFALGLPDGERILQRPYSTASPAAERTELEFLVRLVSHGTFTPRLWAVPIGGRLRIGRPKGLFAERPDDGCARLLLATGTGLAPFVSMLRTMKAEDPDASAHRATVLAHGVSRISEAAYRNELREWAEGRPGRTYLPVVSRPGHPDNAGWAGPSGRLVAVLDSICEAHALSPRDTVVYLCGNPEMIAACTVRLMSRGFPQDRLISEQYWTQRGVLDAATGS